MAAVTITPVRLEEYNSTANLPAPVAVHATDGAVFEMSAADEKCVIIFENAAATAKTATIIKGNSIQGVADLEISIPASGKLFAVIESGRFKNVTGDLKGKVLIKGEDANVKVAVIVQP